MAGIVQDSELLVDNGGGSISADSTIIDPLGQQLAVDSVSVVIASNQPAIPVSGTISVSEPVEVEVNNFPATQAISASSLPLPIGASTSAKQDIGNTSLSSIDSKLTSPITVDGPLTDTELRATPVPVSSTDLDIRNLAFATDKVDVSGSSLSISGSVTVNEPVTVDAIGLDIRNLVFATDKVDASGSSISVSNFPATQPISAVSLPLPDGAATEATQILQATAANQVLAQTSLDEIVTSLTTAQGADGTSVVGPLVQGLVNDSPSSYNPNTIQPLSLTPEGRLRVSVVDSALNQVWVNTFSNPWESLFPATSNSAISFAGEVSYV